IPTTKKERARFHKEVDPMLLHDPDFEKLHKQFRTKIDLGIALLEGAIQHKVPFSVLVFDSWYLAEELVSLARYRKKDWISLLKKNRNLETNSFVLKDVAGQPIRLVEPHIAVEDPVPLIPPTAYRAVTVRDKTYWTFPLAVRLPGLGKVRLVVSCTNAELTGTYVVLVTNRVDWSAQRIIVLYLQRWPIETFYQDGKTHLGLDEDRMRNAEAIGKHWCLGLVAYSLLLLFCLPPSPNSNDFANLFDPPDRGSILVAAVFDAFFSIYIRRTRDLMRIARAGSTLTDPRDLHPDLANRLAQEATK